MDNFYVTNDIWIYGDLRDTLFFNNSLNVLSGADILAKKIGGNKVFVIVAFSDMNKTESYIPLDTAKQKAIEHGADTVLTVDPNDERYFSSYLISQILFQAVSTRKPKVFLFPLTDILREISARCAFSCGSGMIADCTDFTVKNDDIIAICPSSGGEIMAELEFSDSSKTGFISIQPNAFIKKKINNHQGNQEELHIDISTIPCNLTLVSQKKEITHRKSLETAEKVVAGGAGLGNINGFNKVRKLASALDAAIGATRPPVLWHWTDDTNLIGQTGKTIKPKLLITIGTSGAVQYTAGITQAKKIIVINKDPKAPIFKIADIGIVADANQFLPILTRKIKRYAMKALVDAMDKDDSLSSGSDFGSKLFKMRESHNFTQENLADKALCTPEFLQDLENNKTTPSVGFLIKLSKIFDVDPDTFLNSDKREKLSGNRAKEYTKRTTNYHYQTLTPDAENEHLRVFMITIESNQIHKPVAFRHEGEEFIYVMEGKLELTLGEKVHKLLKGESIKFNSQIPHKLKSLADEISKCLVTLYTP
ncbi:MAG: cupin domain-containing protein [Desulfobacula sp.]|nr:cupin domain-containing protein [Desulfobacula sp.]